MRAAATLAAGFSGLTPGTQMRRNHMDMVGLRAKRLEMMVLQYVLADAGFTSSAISSCSETESHHYVATWTLGV